MRWPQEHLSDLGWPRHITALFLVCWHCTLPSVSLGASGLSLVFTILVSCPVSSAILSFSFGSETGDHGTASTLVSMVDEKGGGVYNFVFLLCLFRYVSALGFQGAHIHKMLEYFLVFQLDCFFEDISTVRLQQTYIQYFAWVSSLVWQGIRPHQSPRILGFSS